MKLIIFLFALYGFLESSSYAIYEYKKNKAGAFTLIVISTLGLVLPIFSILI